MGSLTCLFLPLKQCRISLIKNACLYEIALEIVCYVIGCPVVYGVSFERCSLPSCLTLAWVTPLGQPLISAQLWWTVMGSWTSPNSSRSQAVLFCLRAFSRALEAPQEQRGVNTPRSRISLHFFISFIHHFFLSCLTLHPLTAVSSQTIYLH